MNENDCREEEQIDKGRIELLDSYFAYRHNAPGENKEGRMYVLEKKTTIEIVDELQDMLEITKEQLFRYMHNRGYHIAHCQYGSLYWEIWREVKTSPE